MERGAADDGRLSGDRRNYTTGTFTHETKRNSENSYLTALFCKCERAPVEPAHLETINPSNFIQIRRIYDQLSFNLESIHTKRFSAHYSDDNCGVAAYDDGEVDVVCKRQNGGETKPTSSLLQ
ncbi:hypothetical protein EVAR_7709_1 [Eumeta japonica]|uniref:Uncharacterized protein n=1 Tax=Eumeta variegata TaxID=151549 RepID=A0A4C1TIG4_EUMVA|nr:hypothetical protein EVAR_7709_1 [Eumeta japonica]